MKTESNHTNLMDLQMTNRRRPGKSIFFSTEIRDGQFVFVAERVHWTGRDHDDFTTESTHVFTPADLSKRWRALERLGWKVTGTHPRKPRAVSNPATRMLKTACKLAAERCDCHPSPLPKTRGKPLKL